MYIDTFEGRISLTEIVDTFDIPFLKELELSKREYDVEKNKAMKSIQSSVASQQNNKGRTPKTITNTGKVIDR